jgi:hypothetical protein
VYGDTQSGDDTGNLCYYMRTRPVAVAAVCGSQVGDAAAQESGLSAWLYPLLSVSRLESVCLRVQRTRFQHDASQSCSRGQKQINIFLYNIYFESDRASVCEFLALSVANGMRTNSEEYLEKAKK